MKKVVNILMATLVLLSCVSPTCCRDGVGEPDNNGFIGPTLTPEEVAEAIEQLRAAQQEGAQIYIAFTYQGVRANAWRRRCGLPRHRCAPFCRRLPPCGCA